MLSNKQRAFIEHYLTCWNASEAARLSGYSERTARQMGHENLTKPDIRHEISLRLTELQMSADEVLTRLTEQARGSMADFVDAEQGKIDLRKADRHGKLHLLKSYSYTNGEKSDTVRVELYDAQNALALLGKAHKLFVDRNEISGEGGGAIQITSIQAVKPDGA